MITPPAVVLAVIGIPLYWYYSQGGDVAFARTAFTTFAVFCGLGLLPLLEPPIGESISGADADGADVKPTVLAVALLGVYGLFFVIPPARDFFELVPLPWPDVALMAVLALIWAAMTMLFWRLRVVDRLRPMEAKAG